MSGDNSASARAQRAKLQEELYEAQQNLQDQYYDRSISDQQEALDKELESFKEEKDRELEKWDEYLTNIEAIVAESLLNVQLNADDVYNTLSDTANDYNLTLSEAIQNPWEEAATIATNFSDVYDALEVAANEYGMTLSEFLAAPWSEAMESPVYQELFDKLNVIADEYGLDLQEDIISAWANGELAIQSYDDIFGNSASATIEQLDEIKNSWQGIVDQINAAAQAELEYIKRQNEAYEGMIGDPMESEEDAIVRDYTDIGAMSIRNNGNIDDLGDELQLVVGSNGRLEYARIGNSTVQSDIVSNLIPNIEPDVQNLLDKNRPQIVAPHIVNNEVNIDCSVGTMVNIEHCDQNILPDVEKLINKAFDKHMQNLNSSIRRYVR